MKGGKFCLVFPIGGVAADRKNSSGRGRSVQTRDVVGTMTNSTEPQTALAVRRVDRPKTYTIGDLAREFGVTLRTLRFYEDRGLLAPRREAQRASTMPATAPASPSSSRVSNSDSR